MIPEEMSQILHSLLALPHEREWVEFKESKADPQEIGEYLSAIANAAVLHNQSEGFIVWGIKDQTHEIVGTTFRPRHRTIGNQELENWLGSF